MKAVVIAGGYASDELVAVSGHARKALMELGGRPSLSYVLEALSGLSVVVVGANETEPIAREHQAEFLPEGRGAIDNVLAGIEALGVDPNERILVVPADVPLLRAEDVTAFLARCPSDAGVGSAFVPLESIERDHPGAKYGIIRMREGHYATGNLHLLRRSTATRIAETLRALHQSRKSQLKVAMQLGFGTLVRLKIGNLSVAHAKSKIERLLGDVAYGDFAASPRTSLDLDEPEDYVYLRKHWDRLQAL